MLIVLHARYLVRELLVEQKGGIRKPSGKGSRLIILHAGSENRWINEADLVFQSKKVPNIPANSLIVMDNAEFPENALKSELYTLIKMSNFTPKYAVDEMAKAAGHAFTTVSL